MCRGSIVLHDIPRPDRDSWHGVIYAMECALHMEMTINQPKPAEPAWFSQGKRHYPPLRLPRESLSGWTGPSSEGAERQCEQSAPDGGSRERLAWAPLGQAQPALKPPVEWTGMSPLPWDLPLVITPDVHVAFEASSLIFSFWLTVVWNKFVFRKKKKAEAQTWE